MASRLLMRDDGTVFPYSDELSVHKDMREITDEQHELLKGGATVVQVVGSVPAVRGAGSAAQAVEAAESALARAIEDAKQFEDVDDPDADFRDMSKDELRDYASKEFGYEFPADNKITKERMRSEIQERLAPAGLATPETPPVTNPTLAEKVQGESRGVGVGAPTGD